MAGKWSKIRLGQRGSSNAKLLVLARRQARKIFIACLAAFLAIFCLVWELDHYLHWGSASEGADHPDGLVFDVHLRRLDVKQEPPDQLSLDQRRSGAVILHCLGLLYMFVAIAIVCDECFVPALEVISEDLDLSPDVAGATFMAAGGSAPEFFTSLIGSIIVESDIGTGTIIGSAVFNVLFVIGACALIAPEPLHLTWFPLARDSTFYAVDLVVVTVALLDEQVKWFEALILFCLYLTYATFMRYSQRVEEWFMRSPPDQFPDESADVVGEIGGWNLPSTAQGSSEDQAAPADGDKHAPAGGPAGAQLASALSVPSQMGTNSHAGSARSSQASVDAIAGSVRNSSNSPLGSTHSQGRSSVSSMESSLSKQKFKHKSIRHSQMSHHSHHSHPSHPDGAVLSVLDERQAPGAEGADAPSDQAQSSSDPPQKKSDFELTNVVPNSASSSSSSHQAAAGPSKTANSLACQAGDEVKTPSEGEHDEEEEEAAEPLSAWPPENGSFKDWIWWCISIPIVVCLICTIPDVRRDSCRKYYVLTFMSAILWIAFFTWVMMWFAISIAETCGITETIMGLTILAAGTSVPDLLTSMIVARQGHGDMAISSSIGSNIFDVTVGLPVPWMVYAGLNAGKAVKVENQGLEICVLLLLGMLAFTISTIVVHRWIMTKWMGGTLMFLYLLFEVVAVGLTFAPDGELKLIHV